MRHGLKQGGAPTTIDRRDSGVSFHDLLRDSSSIERRASSTMLWRARAGDNSVPGSGGTSSMTSVACPTTTALSAKS
jgi:hypothetical protein